MIDAIPILSYAEALEAERVAVAQFRRALPSLWGSDFDSSLRELQRVRALRARALRIERGERVEDPGTAW